MSDSEKQSGGGARLFVGGLAWQTDEDGLKKAFSEFGDLEECRIVTDRNTGRSKGFGFVTFKDKEAASEAVAKLNGAELDGRTIKCDFANERSSGDRGGERRGGPYDRDRRGGGGGGFRGGRGGFRGGGRDRGDGDFGRSYRRDGGDRDRGGRDRGDRDGRDSRDRRD